MPHDRRAGMARKAFAFEDKGQYEAKIGAAILTINTSVIKIFILTLMVMTWVYQRKRY